MELRTFINSELKDIRDRKILEIYGITPQRAKEIDALDFMSPGCDLLSDIEAMYKCNWWQIDAPPAVMAAEKKEREVLAAMDCWLQAPQVIKEPDYDEYKNGELETVMKNLLSQCEMVA